jgi:hypothetical protein
MGASPSSTTEGVFSLLRQKTPNLTRADVVRVTVSGTGQGDPATLIAGDDGRRWYSRDDPESWVAFEFPRHRIFPTGYQLVVEAAMEDAGQPKSWVFEGSRDGTGWRTLDERRNDATLNSAGRTVGRFACARSGPWKFLRITQTERNRFRRVSEHLLLYGVEIFGDIEDDV